MGIISTKPESSAIISDHKINQKRPKLPHWEAIVASMPDCLPRETQEIIMVYLISVSFVESIQARHLSSFPFFNKNFSLLNDLAAAADHLVSRRFNEIIKILSKNNNPLLLTTSIEVEDHREVILVGTLLEIALYLKEALDEKKETITGIIKHFAVKRCGHGEVAIQVERAHQVMAEDNQKKMLKKC